MDRNRSKQISTLGSRVTSVVSVALMLLLLGIVALTAIAARALTDDVRRNIGFIISMDSEASDADINAMKRTLGDAAFVESYIYSSADEVLEQESAYIGDDVRELIDVNPFSAEFDVRLRPAFANPDSIDVIAAEMRSLPAVGKVMTESALIRGVDSTLRRLTAVLLAIAAAMLLISVVKESAAHKPLGRYNFMGMAFAGILIVTGFLLMLGGSSTEEAFNPDIFSTRRIVVGPAIAFIGFIVMAVAIIIDPARFGGNKKEQN